MSGKRVGIPLAAGRAMLKARPLQTIVLKPEHGISDDLADVVHDWFLMDLVRLPQIHKPRTVLCADASQDIDQIILDAGRGVDPRRSILHGNTIRDGFHQ
ncbi:MAG: hypothetical protein H7Z17_11510 [Fuerstia sp.]|nr:hypothetical protein [Fuerstiella sp.]